MSFKKLNINYVIGFITVLSLVVGFLTIQTFASKGFVELNPINIQILLIINLILLSVFLSFVFYKIFNLYQKNKNKNIIGNKTRAKFLLYFISLAAIPAIIIAIFSMIIFNFSIEKWFDKKINLAVTNSVEIARKYLDEHQSSISKDILLVANDFNRNKEQLLANKKKFEQYIEAQANIRSINNIFIVSDRGELFFSLPSFNKKKFQKPDTYILSASKKGKPVIISSAYSNKTYAMIKLSNFDNLYLYVVQNVSPKIVNYLKNTAEISNYYFEIKTNIFNLQVTFMIIYIMITLLLIFLASIVSINLSTYATDPLISLFDAANQIKKGNYNVKLELKNLDSDFLQLNSTFNEMISKIKEDQKIISLSGRFEAWNIIAKKLAHEIRNPLTPIQLSLDRIRDKFQNQIVTDKNHFDEHILMINNQIKEIAALLNSFSDFARMPNPVFEECSIVNVIDSAINPYKKNYLNIDFVFDSELNAQNIKCDRNQIFRLLTNLIKNSVESIEEMNNFENKGRISILVSENNDFVNCELIDNGPGFKSKNFNNIFEPYFTTKPHGSGLGLSIVSKIVHEHKGNIRFANNENSLGVKINFSLSKNL
jgi:two-component system, NtrC family, nitrogen regulation sensor histidine kinase NtrY